MAKANDLLLPFFLAYLLAARSAFATARESFGQQQGSCQIRSIDAREPSDRIQAEGGTTEFWNHDEDQFRCAGVSIRRHIIKPRGLLLPLYHNAPVLVYAIKGKGLFGVMISGCPETFESSSSFERSEEERSRSGRFRDRHQKIEEFRQGEIAAVPAGAAHWAYNDGNEELVLVIFHDNGNNANQLDQNPRSFFLAGNPARGQQQEQYKQREQGRQLGNVFRGFDTKTLAEVFKVDEETARKLQGQNDERGHIVTVDEGLQVIKPPSEYSRREREEEEEERCYGGRPVNGLEETICTARIREDLDKPSRADVYNPRAGRFTTANSLTLPILSYLRLGVARGVLYRNGIMAPLWYTNAHAVIYATRGESDIQIVDHTGRALFNGRVREGQAVVVPQNFAVVKRASEDQGFEWVVFYTNDQAMYSTLSGRTSAIRGLPADVLANSYQISREEAQRLKSSRQETLIFSGTSGGQRG